MTENINKNTDKKTDIRKRIFDIIQIGNNKDKISRLFDYFIVMVIVLNIAILMLETFEELAYLNNVFKALEIVTIIIFIVEYILRLWTAKYLYPQCTPAKAVVKFIFSYDGIVDILTILPFFIFSGFVAFRMLRVVRIFHLFKINAYYDSFNVITSILKDKKNQILSSVFIIVMLLVASSLFMYSAEHEAQPEVFKNAFSGIWWSMSTILTIGYVDIYPVTIMGKIFGIIIGLLGVGVVAIPTGIISAGFVEHYTMMSRKNISSKLDNGVSYVNIDVNSIFYGRYLSEIEEKEQINIITLVRKDVVILPSANVKIQNNDTIVYIKQ